MSRSNKPTQAEVQRVVAALKAVGETIKSVHIDKDGSFTVLTASNTETPPSPFEAWEREHGHRAA